MNRSVKYGTFLDISQQLESPASLVGSAGRQRGVEALLKRLVLTSLARGTHGRRTFGQQHSGRKIMIRNLVVLYAEIKVGKKMGVLRPMLNYDRSRAKAS